MITELFVLPKQKENNKILPIKYIFSYRNIKCIVPNHNKI